MLKLLIISGRSGSGKSTALHVLEDVGYNCIDNIPASLLPALVESAGSRDDRNAAPLAVSIDARNLPHELERFPEILERLTTGSVAPEIIFLDAELATLVKRFSETRRKHPLSDAHRGLDEALEAESDLLEGIANLADLVIDTTHLTLHDLRDLVRSRVVDRELPGLSLLFRSFGFRHGVPVDADLVFDVRCLPNPHWVPALRERTGLDEEVVAYIEESGDALQMFEDIISYLQRWLPAFERSNRSYMTVAVGCTGGQHRSVWMTEKLYRRFIEGWPNTLVRHRELGRGGSA